VKIKRFVDKDMRQVLRRVREEQGPDAVILSNRRIDEGIEVIAAIDYDAALMQHAIGQSAAARPAGQRDDANHDAHDVRAAMDAGEVARAHAALAVQAQLPDNNQDAAALPVQSAPAGTVHADLRANGPELSTMCGEIKSLRGLLETQVSGLLWKDGTRRSPLRAQILRNLARLGIAPDIANVVVNRLEPVETVRNMWQQPLSTLAQLVPATADPLLTEGGIAALVGPTGVGKTTTIAKLAAHFAMLHGTDSLALVCADAYRIGAREHLAAFASLLGVKVHTASDPEDLRRILRGLESKKLVLVDTEGVGQRDADLARRLTAWRQCSERLRFYLTLSAGSQEAVLDETIRRFRQVPLAAAILTKVDEAGQLGCALSTAIRHDLTLAWIADGQHIPDDLHVAARRKLWLVGRAVDCMEASQPRVDERLMAENYGFASVANA